MPVQEQERILRLQPFLTRLKVVRPIDIYRGNKFLLTIPEGSDLIKIGNGAKRMKVVYKTAPYMVSYTHITCDAIKAIEKIFKSNE